MNIEQLTGWLASDGVDIRCGDCVLEYDPDYGTWVVHNKKKAVSHRGSLQECISFAEKAKQEPLLSADEPQGNGYEE